MEPCDLPYQRKTESGSAKFAAEGFVHAEERLKDALPELLWNAASSVLHINDCLRVLALYRYFYLAAGSIVFDGILYQVKEHPAQQHIAADDGKILPLT